ncbi:MAG TPA: glycosyltransferase [Candidatus Hydrogenedentes bacterium]|nr:glycosyltransferase [Candidatus Hydrogenedentota bacterium]HRK36445.1 glycosyltransferase [Candidatus Hydrogenedentota bacterium]
MKIVHIYKDFDPPVHGGMEHHMALSCWFQRQWAQVEAITCSRDRRTRIVDREGTRVTEVGEWGRFQSAPLSPMFVRHVARIDADIAVVHVPNPTAEVSWLLARPKAKLVVRYQSDVVRQASAMRVYAPIQNRFLARADLILVASHEYLETSVTLRPFKNKCAVVPLGILPEEFALKDPAVVDALRAHYGGPFVLFSGRHRYYKGVEFLVRAAKDIPVPVVIAGDGPERARCEFIARELGVKISFPGALSHDDLVSHLHACEVFAFPSIARSEAYGISMLEAHAAAKPVVATTLGTGVEFVNIDGKTGFNVPPKDPAALASAIRRLLSDQTLREHMGHFAKQRLETQLHAERIARTEFEAYSKLLA